MRQTEPMGEYWADWRPVNHWNLKNHIGDLIHIPVDSVFAWGWKPENDFSGVLEAYEGTGSSLRSTGEYVDLMSHLTIHPYPGRVLEVLGQCLVYHGELKYPEPYRRSVGYRRAERLRESELMASHWHARAFLEPKQEEIFMRFAENQSYDEYPDEAWDVIH